MSKNTVLFVDDEINVLNSLRRGLLDQDYKCIFVESGAEALKIIEKEEISVIVTDMRMPGMDGLTLLKAVKEKSPQTVRVVLSGYTQLQQILATLNQADIFKFITKPWKLEEEFIHVIRQSIDYYNLQRESADLKKALEARNVSYQNILKVMEEKVSEGKKDFDNIKSLGKLAFGGIHSTVFNVMEENSTSNEMIVEALKLCQHFYTGYLTTVPTELVDFDLKKIKSELECYIKGIHPENKILISSEHAKIQNFHDNYKLLTYILTSLWGIVLEKSGPAVLKGVMATEPEEDGIKLGFSMELESMEFGQQGIKYLCDGNLLKLADTLYNEMCKIMKGNLFMDVKEKKLCVKIQLQLNKK